MTDEHELPSLNVVGIYTSPAMGAPMIAHECVRAIAGAGLEGDRYAINMGAFSAARLGKPGRIPDADRQVSLISTGGIDEANTVLEQHGLRPVQYVGTRRGLIIETTAQALLDLIGKRFRIGVVIMEGAEDCAPCHRPAHLACRPDDGAAFKAAFAGRGGLRARILTSGIITVHRSE